MIDVPMPGCLVVDDLIDSGDTLRRYADLECEIAVLYRKPISPRIVGIKGILVSSIETLDGWIRFPWEADHAPTDSVTRLLEYIGEDPKRDGLRETPDRVLRALKEMTIGYGEKPEQILSRVFEEQYDEMVMVRGIPFTSLCEHHLLPFVGEVDLGYIPSDKGVVGLSKLARLVDCFSKRLQVQERMTNEIAKAIEEHLSPRGVAVVVRASHSCMACRGVRKPGAEMVTSSMLGVLRDKPEARAEFLELCRK